MDGRRFDEMTKTVSTGASRRTVAKAVAGGALASALGIFGVRAASAQDDAITSDAKSCRSAGKKCDDDDKCCSNRCRKNNDGKKVCVCRNKGANCLDDDGNRRNKACCGRCKKNGKCS